MSKRRNRKATRKNSGLTWFLVAVILVLAALLAWMITSIDTKKPAAPVQDSEETNAAETEAVSDLPSEEPMQTEVNSEENQILDTELSNGLVITDIGSYTGAYVEDGTNEVVSGVLMMIVENTGDEYIQYAEINLHGSHGQASFTLSTLGPGEKAVILEKNRMAYAEGFTAASADNVAVFREKPDKMENMLEIQLLDGGLNITNISEEDIEGEIIVYFKSYYEGIYYGGITYRGRITGGLKAGEIRQVMSVNISADGTKVVFVSISE